MSGRRPMPEAAEPSLRAATASARSASVARSGLRFCTTSSSGISVLAQCTAPAPTANSATAMVAPSTRVDSADPSELPTSMTK